MLKLKQAVLQLIKNLEPHCQFLSHCHDVLMAKAPKRSLFERGRVVELHKQGLLQHAIAAEVGRSVTVIWNFLNVPEGYGTKTSSGRPQKNSSALSRRIQLAVCQDTGRSSTQIKAVTGADCSPITVRRHLRLKGFKNKKTSSAPHDKGVYHSPILWLITSTDATNHYRVERHPPTLLLAQHLLPYPEESG